MIFPALGEWRQDKMSKTSPASSSPVFIRQKIPTTAKEQRLRRVSKKKHDSEKYFARRMAKSDCTVQLRLSCMGEVCSRMSTAKPAIVYLNSKGAHKQFYSRLKY